MLHRRRFVQDQQAVDWRDIAGVGELSAMSDLPNYVQIGKGTYFANIAFHRWGQERISIGSYCSISQNVSIIAGGNHRTDAVSTYPFDVRMGGKQTAGAGDRCYDHGAGIEIGSDVWIGYGASIIGNVKIGHGAVIAANATVFTDVPPYAVVGGNPAKLLRMRFEPEVIEALLRIAWWDWPESMIRANVESFYLPLEQFIERFRQFTNHAESCYCGTCRDANGVQFPVACSGVLSCA